MRMRLLFGAILAPLLAAAAWSLAAVADDLRQQSAQSVDQPRIDRTAKQALRCTVRRDTNGWWLAEPDGTTFFSLGVCMFNQGTDKNEYEATKPSYSALRHYATPDAWAEASLGRLNAWGFTTIGGWSDYATVRRAGDSRWWLTPVLHMGSTSGAPWFDMWDEKVIRRIEEVAAQNMAATRGDPRVLGYYSDNELGWWNAILWKMTLEQPPSSGQRQRLVRLVRETYADDWQALTRDFEPQNATNWGELEQSGMLWLRPGSEGIRTIRRFLSLAADRYYQLMHDTLHRLEPDAMYLGDRYQSFYYPEVATASRPYVDIVSTNLNASWNDGTFINAYLDTLHQLTGKPIIVSEFYMAARQNQSGNKNSVGGFPEVMTQVERAAGLASTLRELVRRPYVVGADWFQYYDEAPHGRKLDGEDYNFGLVDIHDTPYKDVTDAFAALNLSELKAAAGSRAATASDNQQNSVSFSVAMPVPPAPEDPLVDFQFTRAIKNWDRRRGFFPAVSEHPIGDLYLCWSPAALYLATCVIDIIEPDYYRDGRIPNVDRPLWTIQVNGREPIIARIGAGENPEISDSSARVKSISGLYHDVRCITVIQLPASYFDKESLRPGDEFRLDTSFVSHGRAYRIEWKGRFKLSE
ncbi:MAG TPA: hypothetical protein VJ828_06305 [Lacipirellulaceae bacterium]|nr:hypothetical protein [Lacipirellulaceae bacterium]